MSILDYSINNLSNRRTHLSSYVAREDIIVYYNQLYDFWSPCQTTENSSKNLLSNDESNCWFTRIGSKSSRLSRLRGQSRWVLVYQCNITAQQVMYDVRNVERKVTTLITDLGKASEVIWREAPAYSASVARI